MNYFRSDNFKKFAASFAGPKATTPILAFSILGLLSFGSIFTEVIISAQPTSSLAVDALLSFVISTSYFFIVGLLINRYAEQVSVIRATLLGILYFSTEVIRTLFMGWLIIQNDSTAEIAWGYRITAGGLTGLLFFGLVSVVVNDSVKYRSSFLELQNATNDLKRTTAVTAEDIELTKKRVLETIRASINEALEAVLNNPSPNKENVKLVVDELVRVSDEVVRPLSHELFQDSLALANQTEQLTNRKTSRRRVIQLTTLAEPFHPGLTAFFAFFQFFGLAVFLAKDPVVGLLAVFGFMFWIYVVLQLAKKYLKPKLKKLIIPFRIFSITFIYWLMSVFPALNQTIASYLSLPDSNEILIYFLIIGTILSWSFAIYSAIEFARNETLDSLAKVNEELSWSVARLGAKLWAKQKKLASFVHRDIQGALIASALKFRNDVEAGMDANLALEPIRKLVKETSASVSVNAEAGELKSEISKLNDLWSGIFEFDLDISQEVYQRLSKDSTCLQSTIEFVTEFVTNSVKHGKASNGQVEVSLSDQNILMLSMKNNGSKLSLEMKPGLGTKMAAQQSLTTSFENLPGGGVRFTATLPIA